MARKYFRRNYGSGNPNTLAKKKMFVIRYIVDGVEYIYLDHFYNIYAKAYAMAKSMIPMCDEIFIDVYPLFSANSGKTFNLDKVQKITTHRL